MTPKRLHRDRNMDDDWTESSGQTRGYKNGDKDTAGLNQMGHRVIDWR